MICRSSLRPDGTVVGIGIWLSVDDNLHVILLFMAITILVEKLKHKLFLVLLRPFKQLALKVDIGILQLFQVDVNLDDAFDDDFFCEVKASVEIDGSHKSLKGVATHRPGIVTHIGGVTDKAIKTEFLRELVERNAAHNARAHLRKETLRLRGVGMKQIVGNRCA